jgi:hypothetical protein
LDGREKRFALSFVIGNRDRERLEPRSQEGISRVGVPAGGCGFVRSLGGRRVVGACDGVLHWRPLPHRAAPSPDKAGIATFGYGLRARHERNDGLLDVVLPGLRETAGHGGGVCAAASGIRLRTCFGCSGRANRARCCDSTARKTSLSSASLRARAVRSAVSPTQLIGSCRDSASRSS